MVDTKNLDETQTWLRSTEWTTVKYNVVNPLQKALDWTKDKTAGWGKTYDNLVLPIGDAITDIKEQVPKIPDAFKGVDMTKVFEFGKLLGSNLLLGLNTGLGVASTGTGNLTPLGGGLSDAFSSALSSAIGKGVSSGTLGIPEGLGQAGKGTGFGGLTGKTEEIWNRLKSIFPLVANYWAGGKAGRPAWKSDHPFGRAFDFGGPHTLMDSAAAWLAKNFSSLGLKYIIHDAKIFRGTKWSDYNPPEALKKSASYETAYHLDHVHVSSKYHKGGVVPGPSTKEYVALVRGNEEIDL
jgi:hypothetical protein